MKQGFTLIEVLIATAIASILTVSLFFSFNQINDSVRKASDTIDVFDAALLVDQLLLKDVSGAFIPVQAIPPKETKKNPADTKPDAKVADENKKDADKKPPEKDSQEGMIGGDQAIKDPLLKDPFMSKNIDDRLSVFTFITANPMRVYWSEKAGEPKSSCVRVVYSLEEKKDGDKNEPRYELYRQEGTDLDFGLYSKKESKFEPYLIADNIVSCKLTFIVADEKQEEKEDSLDEKKQPAKPESKKAAKPVIEIKEFKDWTTNKDQKDVRTRLMLPDTVIMTLKLSNPSNTRERSFTFRVPVAARFHEVPIQEPPKTVPGLADKPAAGKSDEDKSLADTSKKEVFVENANKIVQNLRTKFGRA